VDLSDVKKTLQDHLSDGLLTIVGCGLSAAEGLPGMSQLGEHLRKEVPKLLPEKSTDSWKRISSELEKGTDLENCLLKVPPDDDLESLIVSLTGNLVLAAEQAVIEAVLAGKKTLRFTRLLRRLLKPNTGIQVVTTNYDRLIEVAAEVEGLAVDSMFLGSVLGRFNQKESRYSLCRDFARKGKAFYFTYAQHVALFKPHGSLDWFFHEDKPVRCPFPLNLRRLIITPGLNKFKGGYERPFDEHRERANREIDKALRFLIVGYGFNDDHLQTHLAPQLRSGKPAVLLTRDLSTKAAAMLAECGQVIGLSRAADGKGTQVTSKKLSGILSDLDLWDLGIFVKEVLEP
jgi:hypothetical protein